MKYKIKNSINKPTVRRTMMILGPLLVVFALVGAYYLRSLPKEVSTPTDTTSKTTSTAPTAQANFTDGNEREPGNTLHENKGSGEIVDKEGQVNDSISTTDPLVSSTGQISLFTPKQNARLKSGDDIAGASKLKTVSYRIIDDISGVIASGILKVKNGRFSGSITFTTAAKEGRLDIFGAKTDGSEFSNIEVPVTFK